MHTFAFGITGVEGLHSMKLLNIIYLWGFQVSNNDRNRQGQDVCNLGFVHTGAPFIMSSSALSEWFASKVMNIGYFLLY
jgi:hypothetical protein